MSFEEWLEKEYPQLHLDKNMLGIKDWVDFAHACWNAAKEDSKDKAEIIYVDYPCSGLTKNNGNPFWTVRNTCASVFFDTQTEAENWALEQGYRLE